MQWGGVSMLAAKGLGFINWCDWCDFCFCFLFTILPLSCLFSLISTLQYYNIESSTTQSTQFFFFHDFMFWAAAHTTRKMVDLYHNSHHPILVSVLFSPVIPISYQKICKMFLFTSKSNIKGSHSNSCSISGHVLETPQEKCAHDQSFLPPRVQEVQNQTWCRTPYPWSPRLRGIIQLSRIGNVLRNIWFNPESLQFGSRTKQIAPFSCTPRVQEVHTKAEVVNLTPGILGLGVLFNCHA